jgi:hypothetical protein
VPLWIRSSLSLSNSSAIAKVSSSCPSRISWPVPTTAVRRSQMFLDLASLYRIFLGLSNR